MRSPVRIWVSAPKSPRNRKISGTFVVFSLEKMWVKVWVRRATHPLTHYTRRPKSTGQDRPGAFWRFYSHHLLHEISHRLGGLVLHLAGGVSVGAESETGVVVAKHGGDGFHVHAVLQGRGGECVAEVVEAEMLNSGGFEELFVDVHHGVGMVHLPGQGRGEHVGVVRVLGVFLFEEVHGGLGYGHLTNRSFGLGLGEDTCAVRVADILLCDGNGLVFLVKVGPQKRDDLALAQAGGELQIEHWEDITVTGRV